VSKLKAIFISAALVAVLAGCSSNASPTLRAFEGLTPACESYKGGSEIDAVKVTAEANKVPTVEFVTKQTGSSIKAPLANIKETQTKVVKEGSGPTFTGNQLVLAEYAVFSSTTGQSLGASAFNGSNPAAQVFDDTNSLIYCKALSGVKEGSLVMFATPATEDDPEGSLFVIDLKKVFLPHANGDVQSAEAGLPAVVRAPKTGQPGLIQPNFSAPTEFKKAVLIQGKGETVKAGDSVTVHYTGWVWGTTFDSPFDSSWNNGTPVTFNLTTGGLISGFIKAIDGATVGSQIIASLPPADGYGPEGNGTIPANSTLVFVIDILGINK
jgi:peptidylprolyl isomerase